MSGVKISLMMIKTIMYQETLYYIGHLKSYCNITSKKIKCKDSSTAAGKEHCKNFHNWDQKKKKIVMQQAETFW